MRCPLPRAPRVARRAHAGGALRRAGGARSRRTGRASRLGCAAGFRCWSAMGATTPCAPCSFRAGGARRAPGRMARHRRRGRAGAALSGRRRRWCLARWVGAAARARRGSGSRQSTGSLTWGTASHSARWPRPHSGSTSCSRRPSSPPSSASDARRSAALPSAHPVPRARDPCRARQERPRPPAYSSPHAAAPRRARALSGRVLSGRVLSGLTCGRGAGGMVPGWLALGLPGPLPSRAAARSRRRRARHVGRATSQHRGDALGGGVRAAAGGRGGANHHARRAACADGRGELVRGRALG